MNYDETNFTDDPGQERVLVRRGTKHAERIGDSSKTSTSVMFTISGAGEVSSPFIVYKAKYVYDTWTENGHPNAIYRSSPSGWFDMELFEQWFHLICLPYFHKLEGPKALIGDNLPSHISREVIASCEKNDIKFILLLPNSTHLTQPNDVAVFAPLKKSYRQCLMAWKKRNRGVLPKSVFPNILKQAIEGVNNISSNIKAGFRATGIIPLNRQQILQRLPRTLKDIEEENTSLNTTLIGHLETLRPNPSTTAPRGKRLRTIKCGAAVEMSNLEAEIPSKKNKKRINEEEDSVAKKRRKTNSNVLNNRNTKFEETDFVVVKLVNASQKKTKSLCWLHSQ